MQPNTQRSIPQQQDAVLEMPVDSNVLVELTAHVRRHNPALEEAFSTQAGIDPTFASPVLDRNVFVRKTHVGDPDYHPVIPYGTLRYRMVYYGVIS
jgi:hypothetical protein